MAEPARRLDDDQPGVYDAPGTARSSPRPDLKALEGGGESSAPKRGHLKEAGKDSPSRDQLSSAEASPHENAVGRGYVGGNDLGQRWNKDVRRLSVRSVGGFFMRNRKNSIIGGAVAAIIIAAVFIFLAVIPLKIMHIVNNLQSHFYSSTENATEHEAEKLFSDYIRRTLTSCKGAIDKNCNPYPVTGNPVTRLYRGWRNAKLEDKLATQYGLEFKYKGGNYYMKVPGMAGDGGSIDGFINSKSDETLDEFISKANSGEWKKVNRGQVRQMVKDSFANETKWKRVMYRYKVGSLLEEKYGIKRCIIFCKARDALADSVAAKKNAAKLFTVERVIQPRDAALGYVLQCFFTNCDPLKTEPVKCEPGVDCAMHGAPENLETDTFIRQRLEQLATTYGFKNGDALEFLLNQIEKDGLDKFLIKYVMANVFGKTISDTTANSLSKAIPLIGWVNLAAQVVNFGDKGEMKMKKLSYLTNAAAAASLFAMYRVYADEMKTGNVDADEVGSFVNSLGPVGAGASTQDLKGGTAEAEETPLYNSLLGNGTSTGASTYTCKDGKVPTGTVCPEEKLAYDSATLAALKKDVDSVPGLVQIADIWNGTIGKILGFFNDVIGWLVSGSLSLADKACVKIPFTNTYVPSPFSLYCQSRDLISSAMQSIIGYVSSKLFPSPFSENMSGGRTFDMMAAGADVSGNDYAHNGIGGQVLTDGQVAMIRQEQEQDELQSYQNQPLVARIFNTDSQYSPVSKLAMALPSSTDGARVALAGIFTNPIAEIKGGFAAIFHPQLALAASTQPDPFGVTQYGYPMDDPKVQEFFHEDHATYWDKYCADGSQTSQWNQAAADGAPDPNTGMPQNTSFNGCLLIEAATGDAGAEYDSGLLTADDTADSNGANPAPSDTGSGTTIDTSGLFSDSTNIPCAAGTKDLGIQDGYYDGQLVKIRICAVSNIPSTGAESNNGYGVTGAGGKLVVNSRVSAAVYAMAKAAAAAGTPLSASSGFRTMSHQTCLYNKTCGTATAAVPGYSNHQMGLAIDFAVPQCDTIINGQCSDPSNAMWRWLDLNAKDYGYKSGVPSEAWHWSPTGN